MRGSETEPAAELQHGVADAPAADPFLLVITPDSAPLEEDAASRAEAVFEASAAAQREVAVPAIEVLELVGDRADAAGQVEGELGGAAGREAALEQCSGNRRAAGLGLCGAHL